MSKGPWKIKREAKISTTIRLTQGEYDQVLQAAKGTQMSLNKFMSIMLMERIKETKKWLIMSQSS